MTVTSDRVGFRARGSDRRRHECEVSPLPLLPSSNYQHKQHENEKQRLQREGPDQKSYYHELFLCGKPDLTRAMKRLVNPGKRLPDPEGEPDFYAIAKKYPLPDPPPDNVDFDHANGRPAPPPPIYRPATPTAGSSKRQKTGETPTGYGYGQGQGPPYGYPYGGYPPYGYPGMPPR